MLSLDKVFDAEYLVRPASGYVVNTISVSRL